MITFDGDVKTITLDTDTTFKAQDIYDAAAVWAAQPENMIYLIPMVGTGKAALGNNVFTDIIFVLVNGWKLKASGYAAGTTLTITGTLITSDSSSRVVSIEDEGAEVAWVFQVATFGTVTESVLTLGQYIALR